MIDRIDFLASLTQGSESLVDCGCDHGYVAIKAIEDYQVKHCYLLDINEGPLTNAKNNCASKGLLDSCEFILSDGLNKFEGKTDTLLIAGMGGLLIKSIISNDYEKAKKFKKIILAAQSDVDKLRAYLISNYFVFDNEYLIKDGKHNYEIIVCHFDEAKKVKYDLLDMKFGPILRREQSPLFKEIIANKKKMYQEFLHMAKDDESKARLKIELAYIAMLEGALK